MIKQIKKMIPVQFKSEVSAFLAPDQIDVLNQYVGKKKILVFLAGFYQNLGDMALTYSHIKFLEDNFPEYEAVIIPSTSTYRYMKALKRIATPKDIITILGGGNMDDIYVSLENCRRYIIRNFPNNKIVSFPQTMAFSDTPYGRKRLKKTVKTYNKHENLYIFTREAKSFAQMKQHFTNAKIGLVPDMVLYLDKIQPQRERKHILCCLRHDAEMALDTTQSEAIVKTFKELYDDVVITDTVDVPLEGCMPETYDATLHDFWECLKECKVVVTDRLHCMIFCAITKTPCVVLDNTNQKISGVHRQWLHDLPYIKIIHEYDLEVIKEFVAQLIQIDLSQCKDIDLKNVFKPLVDAVKSNMSQ